MYGPRLRKSSTTSPCTRELHHAREARADRPFWLTMASWPPLTLRGGRGPSRGDHPLQWERQPGGPRGPAVCSPTPRLAQSSERDQHKAAAEERSRPSAQPAAPERRRAGALRHDVLSDPRVRSWRSPTHKMVPDNRPPSSSHSPARTTASAGRLPTGAASPLRGRRRHSSSGLTASASGDAKADRGRRGHRTYGIDAEAPTLRSTTALGAWRGD